MKFAKFQFHRSHVFWILDALFMLAYFKFCPTQKIFCFLKIQKREFT